MPRRILRSKKKTWPTAKKYNICAWIKRPKINRKAQRKRTELRINRVWPLFFSFKIPPHSICKSALALCNQHDGFKRP